MKPAITVVWGTVGLLALGVVLWIVLHRYISRQTLPAATEQVITKVITHSPAVPLDLSAYCENGNGVYGPRGSQTFDQVPLKLTGCCCFGAPTTREMDRPFRKNCSAST
jgi:hypothetical protein